jgi:hypothetical protein
MACSRRLRQNTSDAFPERKPLAEGQPLDFRDLLIR